MTQIRDMAVVPVERARVRDGEWGDLAWVLELDGGRVIDHHNRAALQNAADRLNGLLAAAPQALANRDAPGSGLGSSAKADPHREAEGVVVGWKAPRWPTTGTRLRFLGKNGYDHELAAALKVLTPDAIYICVDCSVGDWENSVALEGLAGRFNGVMFEMVAPVVVPPAINTTAGEAG